MVAEGDALTRKYLRDDNMPYLGDLLNETSLLLVNTHYSLSGPKPLSPSVIEIGGVHIQEPKPLEDVSRKIPKLAGESNIHSNLSLILIGFADIFGFCQRWRYLCELGINDSRRNIARRETK